jgi:thiamine-phosphate pyrophosphorylase
MPAIHRILDANFNRAREALRVMEEAARFILDDSKLVADIKALRHDLSHAMASLDNLPWHRDTPGDVGTTVKVSGEMTRQGVPHVVTAAGKRLSEALRAIEEYAKALDTPVTLANNQQAPLPAVIESIRYRGYDIESRLALKLSSGLARQWRLCVLITGDLCVNRDWLSVADAITRPDASGQGAADCIQLREKNLESGEFLARAKALSALLKPRNVALIINDRPDIALLSNADGVHVGQNDLSVADVRKLAGRQLIVGVSTASVEDARCAKNDGADYVGLGPMFPTTTKKKDHIVGPDYLKAFLAAFPGFPHLAIAGITAHNAQVLAQAGARGVAVSSAVCAAQDPARAARDIAKWFSGADEHSQDPSEIRQPHTD